MEYYYEWEITMNEYVDIIYGMIVNMLHRSGQSWQALDDATLSPVSSRSSRSLGDMHSSCSFLRYSSPRGLMSLPFAGERMRVNLPFRPSMLLLSRVVISPSRVFSSQLLSRVGLMTKGNGFASSEEGPCSGRLWEVAFSSLLV